MAEVAAAGTFLCSRDAKFITGMYCTQLAWKFKKSSSNFPWNHFYENFREIDFMENGMKQQFDGILDYIFWKVRFEFIMENIQKRNFTSFFLARQTF